MNVLVTGATGLIGSHLCEKLLADGHGVVALVRDEIPHGYFHDKVRGHCEEVRGDLSGTELILRAILEYDVEAVYHLAAQTIVRYSSISPVGTFEANIRGTWNLLEACRRAPGVKKVLVASSDKAYGDGDLPYSEGQRLAGKYPYDVSKSCADLIAQSYYHTYALPVVVVRCSNVYGPGDLNWTRIIPRTIRRALVGDVSLTLRGRGMMKRDYMHVKDAVAGYLAAFENGACGEAYNFGTGNPVALLYAVEMIFEKLNIPKDFILDQSSESEITHQWIDKTKARKYLNWKPLVEFSDGLDITIPWYREHLSGGSE